jgi:transcriptional regulator with XRE-family HTH domain
MKRGGNKIPKHAGRASLEPGDQLIRLGKRIKKLRIAKGYTSYEYFAYEHDISRAQFGRYEKGQDLRFSTLIKLINAFGMTLPEFFSEGFD